MKGVLSEQYLIVLPTGNALFVLCATFSTTAASVAGQPHTTLLAMRTEIRLVQMLLRDGITPCIRQLEINGLSEKTQARFTGLLGLHAAFEFICLSVLYKSATSAAKHKGYVVLCAFIVQLPDPLVVTGAGTAVVFSVTQYLLYLARWKIFFDGNRSNEWSAHDTFVLEGQLQKYRYSFISPALIFTGDVEHHVLPAITPVFRQVVCDALRTFRQQEEFHVRAPMDDVPGLIPPGVGFLEEEIGGHADSDHFTAFDLVFSAACFAEWIAEPSPCSIDFSAVLITLGIKVIHIAVLATFTALFAAVPWVPDIMQRRSLPSYFFNASLRL